MALLVPSLLSVGLKPVESTTEIKDPEEGSPGEGRRTLTTVTAIRIIERIEEEDPVEGERKETPTMGVIRVAEVAAATTRTMAGEGDTGPEGE